ncbi:MAG: hypothetical protein GXY74_13125 [Phycisphaerae bacterium]|nr:hypothetical protein [Phycisphaerae bacterium]
MGTLSCVKLAAAGVAVLVLAGGAAAQEKLDPIKSVKIGENREFVVNGKPFLPIMSWLQSPSRYATLRGMEFNTFCGTGKAKEAAAAAQAAGGYLIPGFTPDLTNHAYVLAWIHGDEPDMPQKSKQAATPDQIEGRKGGRGQSASFEPRHPPAETMAYYKQVKAADKTRPVLMTFTGHFYRGIQTHYTAEMQDKLYPAYIKAADVVGFDIYPVYGHGRPGWLNQPADAVKQLCEMAGPRPVYAWIETHKGSRWMTYEKQPDVLPMHTRFEVWGALINGATGIGYFTHAWRPSETEFAPTPEMQAELKRLNGQMARLAPAILAPAAKVRVAVAMDDKLPVQFKATSCDGAIYLFVQNRDLGPDAEKLGQFQPISPRGGKARISVDGLKAGTVVEVVDEDRTITAKAGHFEDEFKPLAEHIYKIPQK